MRERGLHGYIPGFSKTFPAHVEWRWGSLISVLSWLLPLQRPLEDAWDALRFEANGQEGLQESRRRGTKDAFSPQAVTDAVRSAFFWAFASMLQQLQHALGKCVGWCRGLGCQRYAQVRYALL